MSVFIILHISLRENVTQEVLLTVIITSFESDHNAENQTIGREPPS